VRAAADWPAVRARALVAGARAPHGRCVHVCVLTARNHLSAVLATGRWRWSAPLHRLTAGALARREEKGWIKRELDPRGWFHWCARVLRAERAELCQSASSSWAFGPGRCQPFPDKRRDPPRSACVNELRMTWSCSLDQAV
jgi:hypothetical protein